MIKVIEGIEGRKRIKGRERASLCQGGIVGGEHDRFMCVTVD